MQKIVHLKMAKNNFSNNWESSGLSRNHEELSEKIQFIEKRIKLQRAHPLYPSQALGNSYQYGGKQLERKSPRHLDDFGISTERKSVREMALEYKDLISKPNLVIHKNGRLNKQEPTINFGNPELLKIVSFENNPLYENHLFISSYNISKKAFNDIGLSPKETNAGSFYSTGCPHWEWSIAWSWKQLNDDPSFSLTEKQKDLIQRVENYKQYKNQFYQNNPDISRDEL